MGQYRVEAYDMYDLPDPRWITVGEFDTAEAARECAAHYMRANLEKLAKEEMLEPDELYSRHLSSGEKAAVFGKPKVDFDANAHVVQAIRELTRSPEWVPEGWIQRSDWRKAAKQALASVGHSLSLKGPFPWSDRGRYRVNAYIAHSLPADEHLQYFLGVPLEPIGLGPSMLILVDTRIAKVVHIGSAGNEG